MIQPASTLFLGFLIGLQHAFEADHIVAVSTMVSEEKNPLKSALVGTFWGMGHTTTLFLIGLLVLLFKISIPERLSLFFELVVGLMLIFLGFRLILLKKLTHHHLHKHGGKEHAHPHIHPSIQHHHQHRRSFFIGGIHGLAGSGALMLLVLSTFRSMVEGVIYIILFGLGSVAGMTFTSTLLGLPLTFSVKKIPKIENYVKNVAGLISIIFGINLVYQVGFVEALIFTLPL